MRKFILILFIFINMLLGNNLKLNNNIQESNKSKQIINLNNEIQSIDIKNIKYKLIVYQDKYDSKHPFLTEDRYNIYYFKSIKKLKIKKIILQFFNILLILSFIIPLFYFFYIIIKYDKIFKEINNKEEIKKFEKKQENIIIFLFFIIFISIFMNILFYIVDIEEKTLYTKEIKLKNNIIVKEKKIINKLEENINDYIIDFNNKEELKLFANKIKEKIEIYNKEIFSLNNKINCLKKDFNNLNNIDKKKLIKKYKNKLIKIKTKIKELNEKVIYLKNILKKIKYYENYLDIKNCLK